MSTNKYLSLDGLGIYDKLIKEKISNGDNSAKEYTNSEVSKKADVIHDHDDRYYTETEIDSKFSDVNSTISNLTTATTVDNKISLHNTSTSAHNDIRALIADLTTRLNNFLNVDDTTTDQLSEVLALIENNKDTLESLTTSKINVSDIVNNLTTNSTSKVLSAAQGVVISNLINNLQEALDIHTHSISDVSNLQSALDGKQSKITGAATSVLYSDLTPSKVLISSSTGKILSSDIDSSYLGAVKFEHLLGLTSDVQTQLNNKASSSHGAHVTYSTTAPVMDGTASAGSATTVARSDHKHPIDTSRASKTEFDAHTTDTTAHMTSSQKTQLSTAYNHSQTAHAPSNAQANQNAFSNIKVGSTTIAADTTTDTLELAGSNVTITPDATNDKVTISVADGSTSTKGVVQLTNSTSSTSTTTAATPNSVKSAYDLANTAQTKADSAQTKADSAYTLASSIQSNVTTLQNDVGSLQTKTNTLESDVDSLQTLLDGQLGFYKVSTTGTNLDDYKTLGIYYFSGSYTPTNIPIGTNGWLIVLPAILSGGSNWKQIWLRQGAASGSSRNDFETFIRTYQGAAWGKWATILTSPLSSTCYGNTLPDPGTPGRIFFLKASN